MKKDDIHTRISKVLRAGVIVSGLFIFVGWILQIEPKHHSFESLEQYTHIGMQDTLSLALQNQNYGLLFSYFGLAVLLGLPIFRVIMTGIIFLKEKDYLMLACVGLVLVGLGIGFNLGV